MNQIDLKNYDTDKSPEYLANYATQFGHLFDESIAMLELGVQRGGSMLLWADLFPHATIAGLDLNRIEIADDSGRIRLYQGFQQDPAVLDRIALEIAPDGFDLIIDDASHVGQYTAASFWHLFPRHLKPGGIYVLDDWSCAYWDDWADGHAYTGPRETLIGMRPNHGPAKPSALERVRRQIRSHARPVAAALPPNVRAWAERIYMKAEGASLQTRFPSHDYGMAGFVKQLVDACAVDEIDRTMSSPRGVIESVHVTDAQVFVTRSASTGPSGP